MGTTAGSSCSAGHALPAPPPQATAATVIATPFTGAAAVGAAGHGAAGEAEGGEDEEKEHHALLRQLKVGDSGGLSARERREARRAGALRVQV